MKRHHDDFRVSQDQKGNWRIFVRTSPEDLDEYDVKIGMREIARRVRAWYEHIDEMSRDRQAAREQEREYEERIKEARTTVDELVKSGAVPASLVDRLFE